MKEEYYIYLIYKPKYHDEELIFCGLSPSLRKEINTNNMVDLQNYILFYSLPLNPNNEIFFEMLKELKPYNFGSKENAKNILKLKSKIHKHNYSKYKIGSLDDIKKDIENFKLIKNIIL